MWSRLRWMIVAVMWLLGGVMLAFSPPLEGGRGGDIMPVMGWVVIFGSVALGGKVLLDAGRVDRAPRHSSGAEADYQGARGQALKFVLGSVGSAASGIFGCWLGLREDDFALLGIGVILVSIGVMGAPEFGPLLRSVIRKRAD